MTRYVRYEREGREAYGVLDGDTIHEMEGDLFAGARETATQIGLAEVRLLAPSLPSKVIAVGLNYRSHLKGRPEPAEPGLFAQLPSAVVGPDDEIVIPPDAKDVHYEGELVVVIGRKAKNVPAARASDFIFGVTAGNDVSERNWQRSDLQWLRAKASDTFAPVGPAIAAGLDYNDLLVRTRLNGELRQSERTRDLIFNVETIVSYVSRYVTLLPGDLVFTGTPGTTAAMQPGDVVEVEVEGIGVLRNTVAASG
ncbi:MAG: fumarylacetoacetate hydrolase family protein [Gemmatimonadota bacterium]|nr:MAG: fumarylacetoacetate hydrolase family protein [Gemmatimonadota bacterium]